jgi:hypothetical protein
MVNLTEKVANELTFLPFLMAGFQRGMAKIALFNGIK